MIKKKESCLRDQNVTVDKYFFQFLQSQSVLIFTSLFQVNVTTENKTVGIGNKERKIKN